jgi:hypothetical protein
MSKGMNTEEITALVSSAGIASDLALHWLNYGFPKVWDVSTYSTAEGMQNIATIVGVGTTATTSGIASEDLKVTIDAMPEPYDRLIARAAVASSFLSSKVTAQSTALGIYSLFITNGFSEALSYTGRQLAPSLLANSVLAFVVPYATSN